MAQFVTWSATAIVVVLLVAFLFHLISLRQLPTTQRPQTNMYDRQGYIVGQDVNPEPADTELEDEQTPK